jgi:hypothetical protein
MSQAPCTTFMAYFAFEMLYSKEKCQEQDFKKESSLSRGKFPTLPNPTLHLLLFAKGSLPLLLIMDKKQAYGSS